jgi:hypothetical protein
MSTPIPGSREADRKARGRRLSKEACGLF